MTKKKVVLAYSGGLDTSVILKWLIEEGYEVIAYIADVGQRDDFKLAKQKALAIGASKVYIEDLKEVFVTDYIFQVFKSGAIYENRYLLGTAIARPLIAKKQIEIARHEGASFVAHGATGKGNDQARFELAYYALEPSIKVIAPWRMEEFLQNFQGRSDMFDYAKKYGIPVTATVGKPYSEDENLLHISHEAGILEDPSAECEEDVYSMTVSPENAPDKTTKVTLTFNNGIPIMVENHETGRVETTPLEIFIYLNQLGAANGIGRLDMVENRFVGIKSRGVYESPGGTILYFAHTDLEGIVMDKEVMRLRDILAMKMTDLIYNGFWFSPEMDFLIQAINKSQEGVNGAVTLKLYKGGVYPVSRESRRSLYDKDIASMDAIGSYKPQDAEGFIKIHAVRLMNHGLSQKMKMGGEK
ncbi:MAG: argininosuccinate synthase [Gammaproteobacteria bacterium]|nr:argininosuccinate synthase [Gammaproteobacteria bacterium]